MIAAPRGRGSETRGNPEATFAGFIREGISSLRGTRHPQCEPGLPDPSSTSASTAATASQALTSGAPPFAPSTSLQELRRMGESLHLAEIRIQRALRAKLLLELYAKLQKEAKRIDAGVGMGGGAAYSEVERALALDKIEPELPIVDCDSTGVKERPSSLRRHAKHFHRSVRKHKWRFVPVGDPALDLQRRLILGRLSGDLYTRLQSMLSASHMMRLLRMLLNKVGGGSRVTTAARRHHEIQCRLEDDIMFLFEEIDVDRTTPSPRVGLVMRVCAESMRQLWPHVTGDGASKGSISMATGADTDRASASSSTSSMAGSRSRQRSPGPLVQLFVELSLQPLLNWRRLFSNSEAAAEKRVSGLQEQADEREDASCERRQLVCDQLTDLLRRARRLLLHRLMVLRMSLGASDDEADSNGVDKGITNVGVSRNLNDSGISIAPSAFAGKSHLRPKDPTIQLTNYGITETHQHFVERLVDAVYFDEECGIAKALSQAFVPRLSQLLNTLGADGPGKNSPEESRGGRTSCGDSNGSHLSAGCGGVGSGVNTASGSACSDTSAEPEGDTNSTNSTNKESNHANHANTFLASFIKNGEQSRLMEAHRIAWTTVKDMRQAGERLAAARAAYCIRKKFRPVLELHMKVEKRLLWHYIQALARGRAREDIWLRQCDPTPQEHHSPLTKKILTRLETEGREFMLGSMRRIVELMRVVHCFSLESDLRVMSPCGVDGLEDNHRGLLQELLMLSKV